MEEDDTSDTKKRKDVPVGNEMSQDDIDKQRGFNEEELKTCLKVLNAFKEQDRLQLLNDKRYRGLRSAGQIFIEGISNRYFGGKSVQDYHRNKQRKIEKKRRKKEQEEEDRVRLSKAEMRSQKLKNLEKLTEENPESLRFMLSDKSENNALHLKPKKVEEEEQVPEQPEDVNSEEEEPALHSARECYICKAGYFQVHSFYDKLCPPCAELNYAKRTPKHDLTGRVALVTGARVKIGYYIALILLRNGAQVIATSRFPHDTALRFSKESDYAEWKDRLHIYGLDMRYLKDVEQFCTLVQENYKTIDIIINNAAQTVRRPPAFYQHLISFEQTPVSQLPEAIQGTIKSQHPAITDSTKETMLLEPAFDVEPTSVMPIRDHTFTAASLSVVPMLPEDHINDPKLFPPGKYDEHNQQLDLRQKTSWVLETDQVTSLELAETHAINVLAPYIINSKLLPLLKASPMKDRFVINVSSVEGQFYHKKTTKHPHTNMAKAALNMMTRTSAAYYAKHKIWMNSVDTGWISDMNPMQRSSRIAKKYGEMFRNPLDEIDGAARVVDPIFMVLQKGAPLFGRFWKDYQIVPW